MKKTIVIIGGGAAGIFSAIRASEQNPQAQVIVLERTRQLLTKVRISGGGRCNVTHALFDPKQFILHYPRGNKELLGPFSQFQAKDTIEWFNKHKVQLKTEEDGRMFPTTDSSQTIITCLLNAAKLNNVDIRLEQKIASIHKNNDQFQIILDNLEPIQCDRLILATGSSPQGHLIAQSFGHTITPLIPSLFTFNVPSSPLLDLTGIAIAQARVSIKNTPLTQTGAILLTHFGFSGPAILKLSAFGAMKLNAHNYNLPITIQWLPTLSFEQIYQALITLKSEKPRKVIDNESLFKLPIQLWKRLIKLSDIPEQSILSILSHASLKKLAALCHGQEFHIEGKTTYKHEFVTCGGIARKEIDFKKMKSRLIPHLYFAGEIIDVDGITGGFNFQHAWTSGWIAGNAINIT